MFLEMKNLPKEIYLQIEPEMPEDFNELYGVTWCNEKINKTDIRYIIDKRHLKSE